MSYTRRELLQQLTLAATLGLPRLHAKKSPDDLPRPEKSDIEHIVVVTMENRSFDHFLGWLPGADGKQAGLTYFDAANKPHVTTHLTDYQGCGHKDPDHSAEGGRMEYNNGACDGWMRADNDDYALGYYTQSDLAFFGQAAPQCVTCDHFFSSIMGETFPNRFYSHAAQTDRITNTMALATMPTIWDLLLARGVSCRYFFSDVPFLALWGPKYLPISAPVQAFLVAAAAGTLPHVSFVDPRFLGAQLGLSGDDHPFADIRNGQVFLNTIYRAVTTGKNWANTVLIIQYDEWGGFFEHVPPTSAPDPDPLHQLRGFRVPALVISPWTQRASVEQGVYDHTSVLKAIEWRWDLPPLTVRDAAANNIAEVLDFRAKEKKAPAYNVPTGPFGGLCIPPTVGELGKWEQLLTVAKNFGWPI